MTTTVAVTGAGGYLGGRVVRELLEAGCQVRALSRRAVPWLDDVTTLDLATADIARLAVHLDGCDAVVHLAGANEVTAAEHVDEAFASTVAAARRVAAASAQSSVPRLVLLSTTHVYGSAARPGERVGVATVPEPRHPYAIARLAAEHLAAAAGPPQLIVLRLTNGVGAPADPRVDRWSLVANDLCRQAVGADIVRLRTSGHQWRDFIALADVARTIRAAVEGTVPTGTFDLGSGRPMRVLDLAELVATEATDLFGREVRAAAPTHDGPSPEPAILDVAPLAALGLAATTPLADAVRETLQACAAASAR